MLRGGSRRASGLVREGGEEGGLLALLGRVRLGLDGPRALVQGLQLCGQGHCVDIFMSISVLHFLELSFYLSFELLCLKVDFSV